MTYFLNSTCVIWSVFTPGGKADADCGPLRTTFAFYIEINTIKPELAVTSIKQPTCLKQPNKMFPNINFVLIFTSVRQPPALSSHFLCFPCVAA